MCNPKGLCTSVTGTGKFKTPYQLISCLTPLRINFQTDEWRGWMQWGFIVYHYFAAVEAYNGMESPLGETLSIYSVASLFAVIRVYVSAYLWQTGFGNWRFFATKV